MTASDQSKARPFESNKVCGAERALSAPPTSRTRLVQRAAPEVSSSAGLIVEESKKGKGMGAKRPAIDGFSRSLFAASSHPHQVEPFDIDATVWAVTFKMASSLTSLPEELLLDIVSRLDCISIRSVAMSCRALYQIFRITAIQYIYELDMNSMKDASSGNPPAELLAVLRDRRKAWADLNWKNVGFVKAGSKFTLYDCVGGVFAQTDGHNFSMFRLPSTSGEGIHTSTPFRVRDFILDIAEDLVIFFHEEELPSGFRRGNVYCRTISTNKQHPACSSASTLSFESFRGRSENGFLSLRLDVVDDVLFLAIQERHGVRIMIWNWKMGFLIYDSLDQLSSTINDLNAIQRDVFILASRAGSGQILIYQFSPTVACIPILIATLSLPKMRTGEIFRFQVDSGQYRDHPAPGELFLPNPTCRTHVFTINHLFSEGWLLFVRSSTFLRFVHSQKDSQEVPWSEWGEQETRFIEKRIRNNWRRYVHGPRVVLMRKDPKSAWVDVFNFSSSPPLVSCSECGLHSRQQHFGSDNPTVIVKGYIFEEDVVTRLPYHVASRKLGGKIPITCMIDEERIVAMQLVGDFLELMVYSF